MTAAPYFAYPTDRTYRYVWVNIPKYYLVPLPKRPPEHLLLPDKQFSMLAPKPPSDPSKLPPLCRIFEGRTSKILLDFAAILGTHETWRVSGSIWKASSEFLHGPEIYNCIILKVLTFTYPVSQIIMHRNIEH